MQCLSGKVYMHNRDWKRLYCACRFQSRSMVSKAVVTMLLLISRWMQVQVMTTIIHLLCSVIQLTRYIASCISQLMLYVLAIAGGNGIIFGISVSRQHTCTVWVRRQRWNTITLLICKYDSFLINFNSTIPYRWITSTHGTASKKLIINCSNYKKSYYYYYSNSEK